jgi:hypothetical protein
MAVWLSAMLVFGACGEVPISPTPAETRVVSVSVAAPSGVLLVGTTQQFAAVPRDAAGAALSGRVVTWSTSDPTIAAIDATGLLTAVRAGTVIVTATSEMRHGSLSLTVTPLPSIAVITPSVLRAGARARIEGEGFVASSLGSSVTVRGVPATIVAASGTSLDIDVPCIETGPAELILTIPGAPAVRRSLSVDVTPIAVPVGQVMLMPNAGASACNELAPIGEPARYLLAVFSVAASANAVADVELSGNATLAAVTAGPIYAESRVVEPPRTRTPADIHGEHLERDRREAERLMSSARSSLRERLPGQRAAAAAVTTGELRNFFFTFGVSCNDSSRVMRTRAIRVGTRSIIWEDTTNSLQSNTDSRLAGYYARIGQIFDDEQYASVARTFGDPLLRDAETDNDGKVHMVFSQRLNSTGAAAYVTSCDQFPRTAAPGSNFGQLLYGAVPVTAVLDVESTESPDGWYAFMSRSVVHEVKHIASNSARVAAGAANFEQVWLEESTARHAEEVWARESLYRVPWKANIGFGTAATLGLYCDFHLADASCTDGDTLHRPSSGMRRHINDLRNKLIEPANRSPFGDAFGQSGSTFYSPAWSLVRYAVDRFAVSEPAFFRALTSATATGMTNLASVSGTTPDQLIGGWGLALVLDDNPALAQPSPTLQIPSFNLRDIYAGLNTSPAWRDRFPTAYPLATTPLSFGAFGARGALIRGGGHAFFELSGVFAVPQLLSVRGGRNSALSADVRLAIVRIE